MDIRNIPNETLVEIIKVSFTWSEAMRKAGKPHPRGASLQYFKKRIQKLNLDTSHFLGKSYHTGIRHTGICKKKLWKDILVMKNGRQRIDCKLLRRAYREYCEENKLLIQCVECGNDGDWRGKKLRLHINHKDESPSNNAPSNLEWRCPNCHDIITIY